MEDLVLDVQEAIRVRTGEKGPEALIKRFLIRDCDGSFRR